MPETDRIASMFRRTGEEQRAALVTYITAGDPAPENSVPLMHRMVAAGADLLELGVPFSDPMADGPVIQAACERALRHGTRLADVLDMVAAFRERDPDTPVVLMGYLNPVESMGYAAFAGRAAEAGVDGLLTVDMPPEEGGGLLSEMREHGLHAIRLLAPTTSEERARRICEAASGFVYYVSVKGVTGGRALDVEEVGRRLQAVRAVTGLPVGVGFGIRDAATAAAVGRVADAIIVGSAIVERIARYADAPDTMMDEVGDIVADLAQALRDNRRTPDEAARG